MFDGLMEPKGTCSLTQREFYSLKYYDEHIKPHVEAEKQAGNITTISRQLSAAHKLSNKLLVAESSHVKLKIKEIYELQKRKRSTTEVPGKVTDPGNIQSVIHLHWTRPVQKLGDIIIVKATSIEKNNYIEFEDGSDCLTDPPISLEHSTSQENGDCLPPSHKAWLPASPQVSMPSEYSTSQEGGDSLPPSHEAWLPTSPKLPMPPPTLKDIDPEVSTVKS
ncbi:hypothetical protein PAXRUDRAFT_28499 [Paxillus rubicundulus Ve08.2h10]|uniref:Uncharacterized protein n=1 Tax=Paxillus rubicundulus Ve08.2h10 TaxID=930991 RepID=A0A0D0CU91_9AGAM|nr:hypothetical protein PAXRUDRAFT_28499 [Paxillus rubicundulus Ve08.2h10]